MVTLNSSFIISQESVCEDSASFDIRVSELKVMLREVERCIEIVSRSSYTGESNRDDLTRFKGSHEQAFI